MIDIKFLRENKEIVQELLNKINKDQELLSEK